VVGTVGLNAAPLMSSVKVVANRPPVRIPAAASATLLRNNRRSIIWPSSIGRNLQRAEWGSDWALTHVRCFAALFLGLIVATRKLIGVVYPFVVFLDRR
jgi:hypothetical protein